VPDILTCLTDSQVLLLALITLSVTLYRQFVYSVIVEVSLPFNGFGLLVE